MSYLILAALVGNIIIGVLAILLSRDLARELAKLRKLQNFEHQRLNLTIQRMDLQQQLLENENARIQCILKSISAVRN